MTEFEMGFWATERMREEQEAAATRRLLRATRHEPRPARSWRARLAAALTGRPARRAETS
jgi:hypothetical protein